jgi:hypothetical protein
LIPSILAYSSLQQKSKQVLEEKERRTTTSTTIRRTRPLRDSNYDLQDVESKKDESDESNKTKDPSSWSLLDRKFGGQKYEWLPKGKPPPTNPAFFCVVQIQPSQVPENCQGTISIPKSGVFQGMDFWWLGTRGISCWKHW